MTEPIAPGGGTPAPEATPLPDRMPDAGQSIVACRALAAPGGLRGNPLLLWGCGLMLVFQLLYTYLPVMHTLFQTAAIDAHSWLLIVACGAIIYPVVELEKRLRAKSRAH